ncbi:hypothetical protein MKX03_027938, partial [Papaver bracteatum]
MPRPRRFRASSSQLANPTASPISPDPAFHSPITQPPSIQGNRVHCPFRDFDDCNDGVNGMGYIRSSFQRHLNDRHFSSDIAKQQCRERLNNDRNIYTSWEQVLLQLRCWLCSHCMTLHAWKKTCKHNNIVIPGPSNGRELDFLISDIAKPPAVVTETSAPSVENTSASISLELLNAAFQRQITTI